MSNNNNKDEVSKIIASIYRYLAEHPNTHKNTVRNELTKRGKISSKTKFSIILESLIQSARIHIEKENISLNPRIVKIGVLQRNSNGYYVVTPDSKIHFPVEKSVGSSYKVGDLLNVVTERKADGTKSAIVLSKSQKNNSASASHETQEQTENKATSMDPNVVLGRVVKISHDNLVFIPNKKSFTTRQFPILNNKEEWASFQDKICTMKLVDIDAPLLGGYITDIKGDAGNFIHEYDAIAEHYGAIMSWEGEEIEKEISELPNKVDVSKLDLIREEDALHLQKGHVVDLRNLNFVTIDPATCKDMDDAIYSTIDENGDIVCYTAVANLSKFFKLHSEIGRRYTRAAFTIYAPNKAYNIAPSKLATGVCSLNPNEPKQAIVFKTILDKHTGQVKNSAIYDALIESRHKYSYEDAQSIVDNMQEVTREMLEEKISTNQALTDEEQILMNSFAAQTIQAGFNNRRMLQFVSNKDRRIVFDQDQTKIEDIKQVPHLATHKLIENFMLTANETAAKYARDNNLNIVYRVHDAPNPKKVDRATEFFDILGIEFDGDLSAQGTTTLLDLIKDTANEEIINNFLIKMQSRALYSDHLYSSKKDDSEHDWAGEKISHYALQSPHYCHSTAVIRRLADYVVHYNILAHIHGTKPLSKDSISKIVDILNQRQIEIDQAEKDFEDISSVMYCEEHIGEKLHGRITKFRYSSPEEGYQDEIIVIVKNQEKGINVEIPLSQVIGQPSYDFDLSGQRCAVYDKKGNAILTICKPLDFIIEKADRKSMTVVGKTTKEFVYEEDNSKYNKKQWDKPNAWTQPSAMHKKEKNDRKKRLENKKGHNSRHSHEDEFEA